MVVVVDLAGQPRFFVKATLGLDIGKIVSLAIGRAVLIGTDIAVSFFILFLL